MSRLPLLWPYGTVDIECHVTWLWPQRNIAKTGDLFKTGIFRLGFIQLCSVHSAPCAIVQLAIAVTGQCNPTKRWDWMHATRGKCSLFEFSAKNFLKIWWTVQLHWIAGQLHANLGHGMLLKPGWYRQSRIGWPRTFLMRHWVVAASL